MKCNKCKVDKHDSLFLSKAKKLKTCNSCRESCQKWRKNNRERVKLYNVTYLTSKDWHNVKIKNGLVTELQQSQPHKFVDGTEGKDCTKCKSWKPLAEYRKRKLKTHPACKDCDRVYRDQNKDNIRSTKRSYEQKMMKYDAVYKLRKSLRSRIWIALKRRMLSKSTRTFELTGCSIPELKQHLESKFQDGMTWENHGEWHIDHIRPCASFNLADEAEQRACFHFSNLQPLWARDNLSKGAKF